MKMLAKYLKQSGLTQSAFAELVGVSGPVVSYWVRGLRVPDRESALAIERVTEGAIPYTAWNGVKAKKPKKAQAA